MEEEGRGDLGEFVLILHQWNRRHVPFHVATIALTVLTDSLRGSSHGVLGGTEFNFRAYLSHLQTLSS